jgi:outer membrane biogenesis lipoprotein LolB
MYPRKITIVFCLFFGMAVLFACTTEKGKESTNKQQVEQTDRQTDTDRQTER